MIRLLALLAMAVLVLSGEAAIARSTLHVGIQLEPPHLDPTQGASDAIGEVTFPTIYEGLTRIATDGTLHPLLATGWTISADGRTYDFTLRHGVHFHDGTPLDAKAVAFSLQRAAAEGSLNLHAAAFRQITALIPLAPDHLRVVLAAADSGFLTTLALSDAAIVSPRAAATLGTRPVGTGPFRLLRWQRGASLQLERVPDYWGGPAHIERLEFRFIADPDAAYAAIRSGALDLYPRFPAPETVAQLARDPRLKVVVAPSEGEVILAMNERTGPLAHVEVRRAIGHALDRRAIIDGAMAGFGTPIGSHFPPQSPDYIDLTGLSAHDPALARRQLAAAGYPQGFALTLKLPPPSYARRTGEIVAAELAAVGIRVTIRNVEWATWLDEVYLHHDFDLTVISHAEPFDYDIYGRKDYYFGYDNPAFDDLLVKLKASADPRERHRLLGEIQRKLAEDAVNGFLFQYPHLGIADRRIEGVWMNSPTQSIDYHAARFADAGSVANGPSAAPGLGLALRLATLVAAVAILGLATRRLGALWLTRRVAVLVVTLLATSLLAFVLLEVAPGDPAATMLGVGASPQAIAALHAELGLDGAAPVRFLHWLTSAVTGDFGTSFTYRVPVAGLIAERLGVSLPLAAGATILSVMVGVPAGILAARRPDGWTDRAIGLFSHLGIAIPDFWAGVLLVLVFALMLGWFPAGGFPGAEAGMATLGRSLVLPVVALALPQAAILARVTRASLNEIMAQDYIRTARMKGLGPWAVLLRHALPNAAAPVLALLGLQVPYLIAGSALVEGVFALPGLGQLALQAIGQRDLVTVQAVVVLMAGATVVASFLVDLAQAVIDPRLTRKPIA